MDDHVITELENAVVELDKWCEESLLDKGSQRRLRRAIGTLEQIRSEQEEKAQEG